MSKAKAGRTWMQQHVADPYVRKARALGYRSRAAFKLAEIDRADRLFAPGQRVVDLGAAPGGWSQVAAARVRAAAGRGQVAAIDIAAMDAIPGVTFVELDFMDDAAPARLAALLADGRADVVLSDMAAPATGHTKTDHLRIMGLAEAAAAFAVAVLVPGGAFLCKVLQGGTERALLDELKRGFASVRHVKPAASRADSAELYVLATGFRGARA
jgi:23S rRNA (uridine2552-2'-O)-methyltransferase